MPQGAHVQSIELLRELQGVLWKFREACVGSLDDVESDLRRTVIWLETEQDTYWKSQIRIRHEALERAKEALRSKKIFKDASGRPQSVVEEQKALKIAMARMAEAEEKLANVRKWVRALQKEIELYKASVGRLSHSVESLVPAAVHQLDRLMTSLEAYVNLEVPQTSAESGGAGEDGAGFTRSADFPAQVPAQSPRLPSDDERISAPLIARMDLRTPPISGEFPGRWPAGEVPPIGPRQTIVVCLTLADSPADYTLIRRTPVYEDDSGWIVTVNAVHLPAEVSWGRLNAESLPGDHEFWGMILRLPVGSCVKVRDGAVVEISQAGEA